MRFKPWMLYASVAIIVLIFVVLVFLAPGKAKAQQEVKPNRLSACSTAPVFQDIPCSEVDRAITESAREFRIDETRMRGTIKCESGFNPFNSPGLFYGLGQHLKREWARRVAAFNRGYDPDVLGNPHSPFDNARVTAWMVHNGGWGAWPTCGR